MSAEMSCHTGRWKLPDFKKGIKRQKSLAKLGTTDPSGNRGSSRKELRAKGAEEVSVMVTRTSIQGIPLD